MSEGLDSTIAIIPARAASKGLPGKNMLMLAGKPLVSQTIDAALTSGRFADVYVTSNDEAVLAFAQRSGGTPITRPESLAGDATSMVDVVLHVYRGLAVEGRATGTAFALLQPTSPLRTAGHIGHCVDVFASGSWSSAVSVCAVDYPPQKTLVNRDGAIEPMFDSQSLCANRQSLEPAYRQNGVIWVVDWLAFRTRKSFVVAPAMPYIMDPLESIDIDTIDDFRRAERVLLGRNSGAGQPPDLQERREGRTGER